MGSGNIMKLEERGVTLPRAPGHEIAGTVVGLGPDAKGSAIGDRVVVYPWIGCGKCEHCLAEEDNMCTTNRILGVIEHGGFSSHVIAPHPRYVVKIGALDPALAATFACSGITVYGAIRKTMPLAPDDAIVLIGAGGLGHAAIAMLGVFGHRKIISVDLDEKKRRAAVAAGATVAIDGSRPDAVAQIAAAAEGPIKAVIDFVNNSSTADFGLQILTKGGKLILVGIAGGELVLSLAGMVFRGLTVQASVTGSVKDLRDVVALAQSGKLKPSPIVRIPKDQANEALLKLKKGEIIGRAVLVDT